MRWGVSGYSGESGLIALGVVFPFALGFFVAFSFLGIVLAVRSLHRQEATTSTVIGLFLNVAPLLIAGAWMLFFSP